MRITPYRIIVLTGLWGWGFVAGQTITISGAQEGYAGRSIEVTIAGNPFLQKPAFSETIVCDDRGAFRAEIETGEGTIIRFASGLYEATLYTEPGKQYEVQLPAYREPAYPERISPFYEPVKIPVKVVGNPTDLNHDIFRFDSLFIPVNEQLLLCRRSGQDPRADSMITALNRHFASGSSPWFDDYRRYKAGILKLNAGRTGLESISLEYLGPVVREHHPAFMELFGAMFKDFLVYYGHTPAGRGIRHQINHTHCLDSLRSIINGHPAVFSDTLGDLILLQELPKLFYHGDFHKEAILILLDSMKSDPVNPAYALYAGQLREHLASLMTGNTPPSFTLTGTDGAAYSPVDFKGKYTFLMFCTPDQYGCMMEYPFLDSYVLKHSDYLEVVTIMVAEHETQVKGFMERNHHQWKALYYQEKMEMLNDYRVRAFPVAYLIGPDGKLILSPAPLPSDGFEQQLFRIMRSRGDI